MNSKKKKKELERKIRERVACEKRAFDIVERMLDNGVQEDDLINSMKFIDPNHYADIVEERAITKVCGYPICDNTLTNVPKKKYHISCKTNQVYNITERKKYCSNRCFEASQHLEGQIPSSPVWARQQEATPNITLRVPVIYSGSPGTVVVSNPRQALKQDVQKLQMPEKIERQKQTVSWPHNVLEGIVDDLPESAGWTTMPISDDILNEKQNDNSEENSFPQNVTQEKKHTHETDDHGLKKVDVCEKIVEVEKQEVHFSEQQVKDTLQSESSGEEKVKDTKAICEVSRGSNSISLSDSGKEKVKQAPLSVILQCLHEWTTLQTVQFLTNSNPQIEQGLKQLHITLDEKHSVTRRLRNDTQSIKCDMGQPDQQAEKELNLPYMDKYSQMALRRKIMLDRLNKMLQNILAQLDLSLQLVSLELHELINTFRLTSQNIVFSPAEWNLVAFIILMLLREKVERVRTAFGMERGERLRKTMCAYMGTTPHRLEQLLDTYRQTVSQQYLTPHLTESLQEELD